MRDIKLKTDNDKSIKKILKDNDFSKRSITEILNQGYLIDDKIFYNNKEIKKDQIISIKIYDENLDYEPINGDLDIIYEDFDILILNKPTNITINSKNQISLANFIANYFKENDIKSKVRFINRLDMNTSGLIMIAKHKFAQSFYQKEIEDNSFIKKYIAVVEGILSIDKEIKVKLNYDEDTKRYDVSDRGDTAITIFKTIKTLKDKDISYIECDIKTGKTHQIRSTLSNMGHPIVGDKLYGSKTPKDRFLLHAYYINFNKFLTKENISFKSMPNFSIS